MIFNESPVSLWELDGSKIKRYIDKLISKGIIDKVPVFIDGLISEATAIHTANPDFLSSDLREKILHQGKNPFLSEFFTTVTSQEERMDIIKGGPCIIMATSGMLIGGPSVQYLRGIAQDQDSSLIFVSYQVSGTNSTTDARSG